ncbi:MAG TPA: hypothetical protein VMU33_19710 [Burkholderiaceae bacterium]|nr:hypothetical protein [Burkholderiaceae bacterium]
MASFSAVAGCNQKADAERLSVVYDSPPSAFNLRSGWVYGRILKEFRSQTAVYICDTPPRNIRFGPIRDSWREIEIDDPARTHGWISEKKLKIRRAASAVPTPMSPSDAREELGGGAAKATPANRLVAIVVPDARAATDGETASLIEWSPELFAVYLLLFLFVILGMLGKVVLDRSESGAGAIDRRRVAQSFAINLVAAPLAYAALLGSCDLQNTQPVDIRTFLMLVCAAFQNGFFWQSCAQRLVPSADGSRTSSSTDIH